MKKIYLTFIFTILLATITNAQNSSSRGSISGKLLDEVSNEPVIEANIRVLAKKDSTFITGKASDKSGSFSIPINNGEYIIHISYIGYADIYKNATVTSTNLNIRLGNILMKDDNLLLDEAVVTAKANEIVVRGDTVEYNADSYKVTQSAVVEDLLKKMPGVEIDSDGKIKVNGREIKKILVDNKEFFSDDPKVASKNLPAKMVDKLQVMERRTDMSLMTGFEDGNEEMVINLTVKPGMKEGVFGNAFAGYGSQDRYEANAMLNYMRNNDQLTFLGGLNNTNNAGFSDLGSAMFGGMGGGGRMMRGGWGGSSGITKSTNGGLNFSNELSKKMTLSGNVRYGDTDTDRNSEVYTQNILSSGNTFEREKNASNNYSQNINMDFRLEWNPDSLTKFIFRPNASFYNNTRTEAGEFSTTRANGEIINHGDSRYNSEGTGKDAGASLEASRQLGKKGRVLSISVSGSVSDSENTGKNLSNTYYEGTKPDDIIDQQSKNTNNSNNIRAYASYVEPLGNNNFLQLAYNFRFNKSESDKDTRTKDENGNYTVLDEDYSKRLENYFSNQNLELNFRSQREKYNYMLGLSMQPSKSHSKTFVGDEMIGDVAQSVINFAPMGQFNYMWSRQKNIRLSYNGSTNQPSVTQLSSVVDISDPLNISYGNPDLKPSFDHRLSIRFQNFDPEKGRSYMLMTNAGFIVNDIVSSRLTDLETGRKESTYENINGNWNLSSRFMTNQPLRNIKFSVFSMTFASYNNSNGFSNGETNTSKRLNLGETLGVNYRSDLFDMSVRGNLSYNKVDNTLQGQQDQKYFNYGGRAETTIYLPYDFEIQSDINYSTNSGYADGFEQKELLWNAGISKQVFKQKNGTLRFKIYDILKQRSDINRSVTSNYIRDTTTNTLTSYFMFHFVYRFNIFKGGAKAEDMSAPGMRGGRGRGYRMH